MLRFFSPGYIATGFVAVLVGYAGAGAIVFQAANAAGATPDQISSWLWAVGIGMGVSSVGLTLFYRQPILIAWSTPGAALLATSLPGVPMGDAIGAFIFSSILLGYPAGSALCVDASPGNPLGSHSHRHRAIGIDIARSLEGPGNPMGSQRHGHRHRAIGIGIGS